MHRYLKAIGFEQIKKKSQFQTLMETILASPDAKISLESDEEECSTLVMKEVEKGIGIAVFGETDPDGSFQPEYHFPYIISDICSSESYCELEKQSEKDCYNGICDDMRLGLNLIFFAVNFMEYKKSLQMQKSWPSIEGVCLSALSLGGKILMPVEKTRAQLEYMKKEEQHFGRLLEAAKNGDQEAIENLTIRDMSMYSQINKRVLKQDLYSVVDTFFMPLGAECDRYTIMGYITSVNSGINKLTGEPLWIMELLCNELPIRLCMTQDSLLGIPQKGYRFKGEIWLQGKCLLG